MVKLISTNPGKNYEVVGEVEVSTPQEIRQKVEAAQKVKLSWKEMSVVRRREYVEQIYQIIQDHKDELGDLSTKEIGMPVGMRNVIDIEPGFDYFRWYLDNVEKSIAAEITYEDDKFVNTVYYEPVGVVAVISPWNYPLTNFIWGVIPSLLVGNPVVWKHSEECPLFSQKIDQLIKEVDLPEGVFSVVYGAGDVGDMLVHENVQLLSFTGSTKVGEYLYKVAAEKFIKVILELGGSAPGIVFEDADIDEVMEMVYFNRFLHSGQICDGLKRLIVHESRYQEVIEKLKTFLSTKKIGVPDDSSTEIGPLVAKRQLDLLESQVADAIEKGAYIEVGGRKPEKPQGAYYMPTVITNITTDMRVWREEVFGPVLPVVTFSTEQEAIRLANDTQYGLGSYVFSKDKQKTFRVASKIDAGMVSTNMAWHIRPCNPFGGYKKSGMGREHGKYGFQELCQLKIVATEK